jgi:hypothetical protein
VVVSVGAKAQGKNLEQVRIRKTNESEPTEDASFVIVLAVQYHVREARASSALFFSVIGSMFTMGIFIALTH